MIVGYTLNAAPAWRLVLVDWSLIRNGYLRRYHSILCAASCATLWTSPMGRTTTCSLRNVTYSHGLLFAVAAPSIVTERDTATMTAEYPPSPYARDHAAAMLHGYLTRTYATAADYGLDMRQWDETVGRAAEVLRNL